MSDHTPDSFAPAAENYLPTPQFKYSPNQREIDFAQIIASGGDLIEALSIASLVTAEEREKSTRPQLYAMGTRLLNNPAIQERIDFYAILHKASMDISVERIQQELAACSFSDFAQVFHKEDGPIVQKKNPFHDPEDPESEELLLEPEWLAGEPIKNPHHLPRHIRAAIKEWGFDKDGVMKVKFHDKLKAVKTLGEMEGHFDESNRAKATQVNISIGDGRGTEKAREIIDVTPERERPELDCLE
ncbi:MAG: terminase small subunit [Candidatus Sabulitectum sp.]|nr:terminase small subunit [Candidatus Sabulitectum sp.]